MKTLPLSKGFVALVDDEDFGYLNQWKWTYNSGYAVRRFRLNGKQHTRLLHHELMPDYTRNVRHVDHINRNGLDNTRANLRYLTQQQNTLNSKGGAGKLGLRGVRFMPLPANTKKPFNAYIFGNGKQRSLGCYATAIEAARVYDEAAKTDSPFRPLNNV